ncbi:MAG: DotU family type IV/VI secretion system protein [Deltaproteobacteria bacterium]|nr:DotU family type IV/VI secretion system protein [Deltaproteobacteria bacterium]MBS3919736.1 DotU family type IV/VI secretion system protein [Deltaproteobacteria bacterium]
MHLTDAFMELVAYVVYFVKTVGAKQPPYDQAKTDILRLLTQSENVVKRGLFSQEDYDLGRFMICAWVDETILSSAWNQKAQWQREQLQRLYYHTLDAGEEAFERLNGLGLHQREVREVYYLCLALGFKGRFHHPGDEHLLEQVKTSNLKLLLGSSVGLPSLERAELFPEAFPVEAVELGPQKQKFRLSPFTIACLAGPVILFGLLFLIYQFALSGVGENFLKAVP